MKKHSGLSKSKLYFLFAATFFACIAIVLSVVSITSAALIDEGILPVDFYTNSTYILNIIMITSALISFIVILLIQVLLLHPILKMSDALESLSNGNFDVRVKVSGNGLYSSEINRFANNFNQTAEKLGSVEILRNDFVNNVSHEFKTPIVSIKSAAALIKVDSLTQEENDEYLSIIINESDRLSNLAANVLELSRLESETLLQNANSYNISEQIRQTILLLDEKLQSKDLEIDFNLEPVEFYGNSMLMKQVWINLLDNAIKFSPNKSVIGVELKQNGNNIVAAIKDNGVGISDDVKNHIFDKFFQGDSSHSSQGNGLGLSLVKKIVELHNGSIQVESVLGKGSVFNISLPLTI